MQEGRSDLLQLLDDRLNDLAHFLLRASEQLGELAGRQSFVDEERQQDLLSLLERRRGLISANLRWHRSRRGHLLALADGVAREELDHGLTDAVEVGAQLLQHLGGDALAFADEAEQDVLGADVVVAELQRLSE